MTQATDIAAPKVGLFGFTGYQWLVFFICWLGWALDAVDFGLFSFVLRPATTELLGGNPSPADVTYWGGILAMVGLLGWAFGGLFFGIVADYIGRVRALVVSILMYSIFTGMQGFAQEIWHLGLFRFLAGLGTGAEAVVGIALVAEAFAERSRAKMLGIMMTGGAFGPLIGGYVYAWLGPYGWRYVFFAGIAPALLLLLVRRGMGEPRHFNDMKERRAAAAGAAAPSAEDKELTSFPPMLLFSRRNRYSTMIGLLFCLGTLLAIWTSQIWLPTIQQLMLEKAGIKGQAAIPLVAWGMKLWGIGGILGYASFGFIADVIGRRWTIILYNLGTIASGVYLYGILDSYEMYPYVLPVFGFFVFGVFSGHAVYLPELFPTNMRATAFAFCNGTGRIITAFGPLIAGTMATVLFSGNLNIGAAVMTCCAVFSILAMLLGRETRDDELPK